MSDYTKLVVWRKAHALALDVYRETKKWPRHEQYGLISQARRAATSIPCNLAEGCGRNSDAELARFVSIAAGSAAELSYLLLLATDLGYLAATTDPKQRGVVDVQRMLWSLQQKLRKGRVDRSRPTSSRSQQLAND